MSCFLSNSSLGKKLVMSVTGCFLVLFILFHMSMNIVAIISPEAYNMICALLGANWYALAGTLVLAAGVVIHFIYAVILTLENRKARGSQRYAVTVVGQRHVVSPPEMHRQYRSDDHLPRLCRRRGGLLHQEHLPLLRRRLLTDYPEQ